MSLIFPADRRILIVCGHYGSGKTEFAVSLAAALAENNTTGYSRLALCDLDIVNPYFRSREQTEMLESIGVKVYGGLYGSGTTAEIPEVAAAVRAPLEDNDCFTIVDAGGNDSGVRVLTQFKKYFTPETTFTAMVVNASRPDTADVDGVLFHMDALQKELGLPVEYLVSNTHMLTYTETSHVERGYKLCRDVSAKIGVPILCACYPEKYVSAESLTNIDCPKFPLGMYMRQSWLDR